MNLRATRGGRVYPGSTVKHLTSCTCVLCDPGNTKLAAQRERYLSEERARAATGATAPPAPARAPALLRRYRPARSEDTRRLAELLHEGKTFVQAAEIIESEKRPQPEEPTT